jgi:genome maintenance exonuclease 1
MWVSFKPLVERIEEVYALEAPLYSKFLGIAGTVDCVGLWNGRLSIIDFKTSSRVKSAEDIPSYFMQCAAYAVMWEELTKKPITQLVVLMAVEDELPLVFVEHRDNWIKEFMQLRKQYKETFGL